MLAPENQKEILIVDRDVATLEPLRQQLKHAGFIVLAITDSAAAVVAVELSPPQLLIVDWNMPGLAPLELLECVRKARLLQQLRRVTPSGLLGEKQIVLRCIMCAH